MRYFIFLIILISFISCKNSTGICSITSNELLLQNNKRVFGTNVKNNIIDEYRDKGIDSIKGSYYSFYRNGCLKQYQFFVDMQTYTYSEEYDINKNLTKVQGNPFVFNRVKRISSDSFFYSVYLFAMNKQYEKLHISSSSGKNFFVDIKKDTLFSNVEAASFGIKFVEQGNITVRFETKITDLCTRKSEIIRDSISIFKKPINH